jgi:hypothetical protein
MDPPNYFEAIRQRASDQWDLLERDRELAGPWHQLFKQVQSPRHVVSELLQNADDAGATEAAVAIENGEFVFSHNGEDFTSEHLASLCRFGYSNKRTLHTIGFRGIGFKSTFSLGDEVRLLTPTLHLAYRRDRFTEPVWLNGSYRPRSTTEVRVKIKDTHRERELSKNLEEWMASPASLLFFRNLRSLRILDRDVRWLPGEAGPIDNSEWVALSSAPDQKYLLIRSELEPFPEDALEEIRQERMVSLEEEADLPPCRVEVLLGLEGRLFVILPTGVKTDLPFACNAPFVQDPARVKIKDPETSPTNRWLLGRAGELAANAMIDWVGVAGMPAKERCAAYALLSDVDRDDNSIEGVSASIVELAINEVIKERPFLLAEDESIQRWGECRSVDPALLEVWSAEQIADHFSEDRLPILSHHIGASDREKLISWSCVEKLDDDEVIEVIQNEQLPKPDSWRKLLTLWTFVDRSMPAYRYRRSGSNYHIVPVPGKDVLQGSDGVVRLGEKRLMQRDEDWEFLSENLLVLDSNWPRYLAKQRRDAEEQDDEPLSEEVEAAYRVLAALGFSETNDVNQTMALVTDRFFANDECSVDDSVRLAHIAAKLGAAVPNQFMFVTRDECLAESNHGIVFDARGDLDRYFSEDWLNDHVLHEAYIANFQACTRDEWEHWIGSGRSKVKTFAPLLEMEISLWGKAELAVFLQRKGFDGEPNYKYRSRNFTVRDWDFDEQVWEHWEQAATQDDTFWGRILERILLQPKSYWPRDMSIKVEQKSTNGRSAIIIDESILPAWIERFRNLNCLEDTRGMYRQPAELLLRTPATEALLDVEPFVRAELDTEATRSLLALLGVRDTPTGPDSILDRLRTLARSDSPPVYEVEKWYHRLDQLLRECSTDETELVRDAFNNERLILSDAGLWVNSSEVFLFAEDEDVPGAALVHPSAGHLSMWPRLGIAERPSLELAMNWLATLPSGEVLERDEGRRVRALLSRYPDRIWNECRHWLNLEDEWVDINQLSYGLSMHSLVSWKHLFSDIKKKTADLQGLSAETCRSFPFSELPTLSSVIEERLENPIVDVPLTKPKPWVTTLGNGLSRVILENDEENLRVRTLADRLARIDWRVVEVLRTVPYINGTPAGTPRAVKVLWNDTDLYVSKGSPAQVALNVAQELGRFFERAEITDAIKFCYERDPDFIKDYLDGSFKLIPIEQVATDIQNENDGGLIETVQEAAPSDNLEIDSDAGPINSGDEIEFDEDSMAETLPNDSDLVELSNPLPEPENGAVDAPVKTRPHVSKPRLIDRFANALGYAAITPDRFEHEDGSWIAKSPESTFPWLRYDRDGDLIQCYWTKEHCMQIKPLELPAEVWQLCIDSPDRYSLVLFDREGAPIDVPGRTLSTLLSEEKIKLYPSWYRIVNTD